MSATKEAYYDAHGCYPGEEINAACQDCQEPRERVDWGEQEGRCNACLDAYLGAP